MCCVERELGQLRELGGLCEVEGEVVKSVEQVVGEVDGGFWFQWWYGEGGKRDTGWFCFRGVDRVDQRVDWVVTGLREWA